MTERAVELIWLVLAGYAGVGAAVTLILFAGVLQRIDATAAGAPIRVKLLIAPGLMAWWPVLVLRLAGVKPSEDRL